MIAKERIPRSFRGGLYQLLRAPEAPYTAGFILTRRAEGLSTRVLLMLRRPLTAFCMVPISSLLHCAPGNQRDLLSTSPDRYAGLFLKERRRAEKRRSKNTTQTGLLSEEDELDIVLHVEEEKTFEQALQVDIEASVEMPTGKVQDLPPPPTTQEEVRRSPSHKAFEHSQKVELNGLRGVGCFKVKDDKDVQTVGKLSGLDGCTHTWAMNLEIA